jgi:hypothetical protein
MIMMESKIVMVSNIVFFENFDNFWFIIFYGDQYIR